MICWILLLLILTSCVSGTLVVTATQSSYQAEENQHITLEWTFTPTPPNTSSISIYCGLLADHDLPVLYHQHEGVEVPESQGEQFSGRVQFDKDVLREGRLRLHVSRLRTEDSGRYMCQVITDDGQGSDECRLNVTAAVDRPQKQIVRPEPEPEPGPGSRGRIGLYVGLVLITTAAASVLVLIKLGFIKFVDKT